MRPRQLHDLRLLPTKDDPRPTFNDAVIAQNESASAGKTPDLGKLLAKGQTWTVEEGHPET